jgi:hypothetical protein
VKAIGALGAEGKPAFGLLMKATDDKVWTVRGAAIRALGDIAPTGRDARLVEEKAYKALGEPAIVFSAVRSC